MTETNPAQSKFQLTETLLPPAKCVFCGRSKQEPMVSGNLYIEFYGQIYIHIGCAQEIARVVEFGPVAELHVAQAEIIAKDEEIAALESKLEVERENVRVLTRITSGSDDSGSSDSSGSDVVNPVANESEPEESEKPKPRPRAGKVVPKKSGNGPSESSSS